MVIKMNRIKYLVNRVRNLNFTDLRTTVDYVSQKTKKPKIIIFLDIVWCGFFYLGGYTDYRIFKMYELNFSQRKTLLTRGKNNKYIKKLNNKKDWHLVHHKNEFNQLFADYINRKWLFLNNNYQEFQQFIKDKIFIIAKPTSGSQGIGIEKIKIKDYQPKELYNYLIEKNLTIVEEELRQHDVLHKLHPHSVNTLRIVTILHKQQVHIIAAYLRIGNQNIVDGMTGGGMVAPIDIKNGTIKFPAANKNDETFVEHPLTKQKIPGLAIPYWQEILNLSNELPHKIPTLKMIGWDIAITNYGPELIEANQYPAHQSYQLPPHLENKTGALPKIKNIFS